MSSTREFRNAELLEAALNDIQRSVEAARRLYQTTVMNLPEGTADLNAFFDEITDVVEYGIRELG